MMKEGFFLLLTNIMGMLSMPLISQTDSLQYYYQKSVEAHKAEDYTSFLETAAAANRLRPNHPTLTYNLAAAYSLNQQPEKALKYLRSFVLMNSSHDFIQDADFKPIMEEKGIAELLQLREILSDSISNSQIELELADNDFHPECMAYSQKNAAYYFGKVHQPGVIAYSAEGLSEVLLEGSQLDNLYSVLGIAVDNKKNSLWLVSTVLPQMAGYHEEIKGKSSVYEIDLKTKRVLTSILLLSESRLGEILFHEGTVYIADGLSNKIYRVKSGDKTLSLVADLSADARNLQGMAIDARNDYLFASDYVSGLFKVEIREGSYRRLSMADDIPFKGIDGVFFHKNTLIVTQNGSSPMRVMRLILDKKQERVIDKEIIDQNCRYLNEPTQGLIFKNAFYYIANSPWGAYDKNMHFKPEQWGDIQIRKTNLNKKL